MRPLGRRALLRFLALAPFLGSALAAPEPVPRLSPAERRLAAFGGRLVASDPATAERLHRFAVREACSAGACDDADGICAVLLRDTRVAAELRRGLVHRVDGWLLARSEASVCVYLHRLARAHSSR